MVARRVLIFMQGSDRDQLYDVGSFVPGELYLSCFLFFAPSSLRASDMLFLRLKTRTTGKGDNNINHKFTQYRSILLRPDANRGFFEMTMNQIMEYSSLAYSFNIEEISQFEHIIFLLASK